MDQEESYICYLHPSKGVLQGREEREIEIKIIPQVAKFIELLVITVEIFVDFVECVIKFFFVILKYI
jgi:hypothetical protein